MSEKHRCVVLGNLGLIADCGEQHFMSDMRNGTADPRVSSVVRRVTKLYGSHGYRFGSYGGIFPSWRTLHHPAWARYPDYEKEWKYNFGGTVNDADVELFAELRSLVDVIVAVVYSVSVQCALPTRHGRLKR